MTARGTLRNTALRVTVEGDETTFVVSRDDNKIELALSTDDVRDVIEMFREALSVAEHNEMNEGEDDES